MKLKEILETIVEKYEKENERKFLFLCHFIEEINLLDRDIQRVKKFISMAIPVINFDPSKDFNVFNLSNRDLTIMNDTLKDPVHLTFTLGMAHNIKQERIIILRYYIQHLKKGRSINHINNQLSKKLGND